MNTQHIKIISNMALIGTFVNVFKTILGNSYNGLARLHISAVNFGKMKFINQGIDITKYTMKPLPLPRSGGRGHNGRILTNRIGGGHKKRYRMVDFTRLAPKSGPQVVEKVMAVRYDPCRSADIAIVAGSCRKRYILASQKMKKGDIIKTSAEIPRMAVKAEEGDAHPLGALPLGTIVHNVEVYPGAGGRVARAAGTCGQLVRKIGDRCIVKMPSKREINVSYECMATVGRVSNVDHNKEHIGSPGRARWFGIRPRSGLWHRKTGYHGRKIRPIKKMVTYDKPPAPKVSSYRFTF